MKKIIVLIAFTFSLVACDRYQTPTDEFVVKIDSLICEDTIVENQSLEIQLYGTIGIDSCCSFSRIYENVDTNSIQLIVLAKPTPMPKAKGDTLHLSIQHAIETIPADSLVIEIVNPGFENKLSKTVFVSKK